MTLKQLEAFYWTAKLGNFSAAAARLHLTPSSLSKRIAELETEFDCRLLERSSQRALLTEAGERMIEHVRQMLKIESDIKAELETAPALRGICRFGISELIASTWFPKFVRRVQALHPDLILEPYVDLTERCERLVDRGELDFAVIPGPSSRDELVSEEIARLQYAWMASPERITPGTMLTPEHFCALPVITLSPEARLTRNINDWAAGHQLTIRRALTCNSLTALIELTMAGVGISFFPIDYIRPLTEAGYLVPFETDMPLPELHYCFESRRDDKRQMVAALKTLVIEEADFTLGVRSLYQRAMH